MIKKVLEEREKTHGNFEGVSLTAQSIKLAIRTGPNQDDIDPLLLESLDMIASKMARIVNGDPMHKDHWVDIIGYAQLAINALEQPERDK